ncbi:hypothetical protein [Lactobacillus sp. HT06-2]|uniref:hypothetical protein n=1 Tax=Lactobacillus sp. HT06-2 TaxID=2080222 RepID=UPI000CD8E8E3|nr:hypothetical protein [Lactobacillus sp. HT06-2]
MAKEFDKLNHWQVAVGFFGEDDAKLLMIVRANEYGITIKPKPGNKTGYLMVPFKGDDGKQHFYKLKETVIPARPFIENAWNDNKHKYKKMIDDGLDGIFRGKDTAMKLLNRLGVESVKDIQESAVQLREPKNAPLTVANKGSDNPLVDTGELERKVTYKIIPG